MRQAGFELGKRFVTLVEYLVNLVYELLPRLPVNDPWCFFGWKNDYFSVAGQRSRGLSDTVNWQVKVICYVISGCEVPGFFHFQFEYFLDVSAFSFFQIKRGEKFFSLMFSRVSV